MNIHETLRQLEITKLAKTEISAGGPGSGRRPGMNHIVQVSHLTKGNDAKSKDIQRIAKAAGAKDVYGGPRLSNGVLYSPTTYHAFKTKDKDSAISLVKALRDAGHGKVSYNQISNNSKFW